MKKAKALKDFRNMSYGDLLNKALAVKAGFTDNAGFPSPVPGLDDLHTVTGLYAQAMVQAESNDKVKVAQKKTLRLSVEAILSQLADYANYIANGNRALLLSTALTVTAEKVTPGELGPVNHCTVVQGKNSGEVIVSIDRVENAKSYVYCYSDVPVVGDNWKVAYGATSKRLTGLQRGKEYAFRVGAISKETTVYSPVTIFLVS